MNYNHKRDRIRINILPIVFGVFITCISYKLPLKDVNDLLEKSIDSMLQVWGILLGFMIAADSVLLMFNDGRFIKMLKDSGHYKTILLAFLYCCVHLLVGVIFAMFMLLYQWNSCKVFYLLCGMAADITVIVGECLYFLFGIVKKIE